MSDRLRKGTLALAVAAALLSTAILGTAATGAQPLRTAKAATKSCSTAGLRYSRKQGGATFSVAVANLKAKAESCSQARSLAATVAKDILRETKVPATIAGLKVEVKEPCAGCTPDTQISAKSGGKVVTFTVKGGA
jgi:hypothetical protein